MKKIAILTDSTSDIPKDLASKYGIYIVPLKVIYKDKTYSDGVDIEPDTVYQNLANEVPTTSLPTGEDIEATFEKIKADGFTDVLCIHVSSNLSGTFNMMKIVADDISGLNIKLFDTKSVAMGLGMTVIDLANFVLDGSKSLDEAYEYLANTYQDSKIYFSLNTFEYLIKGGRVGKVTGILGAKMNLKPVMACNDEGVYHTVTKAIGRKQSIKKVIEAAEAFAANHKAYNICVSHSAAFEEATEVMNIVKAKLTHAKNVYMTNITPVLGVHAGPGLIGVGVHLIK